MTDHLARTLQAIRATLEGDSTAVGTLFTSDVRASISTTVWSASAVHVRTLTVEDAVLEPTGRRVELARITVAEFSGDRISAFRQHWDCVALMDGHASRRLRRQRG